MKENEKKFLEAQAWYEKGDFGESLKLFQELENENAKLAGVYFYLGLLYNFKFSDLEKAEYYYKKTLKLDPDYTPVKFTYVGFLQSSNRFGDLEPFLDKILKDIPSAKADACLEYGVMREAQLRYGEALNYYELAMKHAINPEFTQRIKDARNRCLEKRRVSSPFWRMLTSPYFLPVMVSAALLMAFFSVFHSLNGK